MELRGVGPELGRVAALDLAGRVEAGDDLLLALADFGGAGLLEALVDEVGELVGLDALGLDVEVGEEVGAERLDQVDLGLEGDAALLA